MLTLTCNVGAIGVDSHIDPVPGSHTAHPDTDLKVMEEKTHHASPSDEALASIEPHKPNHEIPASVDSAAHGKIRLARTHFGHGLAAHCVSHKACTT